MSVAQKTVSYCTEVDNLLGLVTGAVGEVKSGKSVTQVVEDMIPSFVAALQGLGDLKTEVADRKDLEATVALKLAELVNVFVP